MRVDDREQNRLPVGGCATVQMKIVPSMWIRFDSYRNFLRRFPPWRDRKGDPDLFRFAYPNHKPRSRKLWVILAVFLVFYNCLALYLFARENQRNQHLLNSKAGLAERVASLPDPGQETPYHFVYAEKDEPLLLCEKETKTLFCFRFEGEKFSLFRAYRCILGANNHDKKKNGDAATPLGVYFFLRYIPGKSLPPQYGFGSYVLNYPNFLDRLDKKQGGGIWLHGHNEAQSPGEDLTNTKGCIVVSNSDLQEMGAYLNPRGNPIVVVNKLRFSARQYQKELSRELTSLVNSWKQAWESLDTQKYLSFYSQDFRRGGMGYSGFKKYKERVNRGKKQIRVEVEDLAILLPPEYEGKVAVARFDQHYTSSNFRDDCKKLQYWRKGLGGWQIISENVF